MRKYRDLAHLTDQREALERRADRSQELTEHLEGAAEPLAMDDVYAETRALLKFLTSLPDSYDSDEYWNLQAAITADVHEGGSPNLIYALARVDPVHYDACVLLCEDKLCNGGQLHPVETRFLLDVLRGRVTKPKRRGPDPYERHHRNKKICAAVYVINRNHPGIPIYDAFDNGIANACAIVSECLEDVGIYLSTAAVKKIWLSDGDLFDDEVLGEVMGEPIQKS